MFACRSCQIGVVETSARLSADFETVHGENVEIGQIFDGEEFGPDFVRIGHQFERI